MTAGPCPCPCPWGRIPLWGTFVGLKRVLGHNFGGIKGLGAQFWVEGGSVGHNFGVRGLCGHNFGGIKGLGAHFMKAPML